MDKRTIMQQYRQKQPKYTKAIFLLLYLFSKITLADPWFTGALLGSSGKIIPNGHTNVELYSINARSNGHYDDEGEIIHTPVFKTYLSIAQITHGFTDWLDIQLTVPYAFNSTQGSNYNRLGDVALLAGFQLLQQNESPYRVNLRVTLKEIFPTGRYDHLDAAMHGTDATGLGSYQTRLALNFQHLIKVYNDHYLRTRLILTHMYFNPVNIYGLSTYGGEPNGIGKIKKGDENDINLSFEYTLTQNWVLVMEGLSVHGKSTRFNGLLNFGGLTRLSNFLTRGDFSQQSLAPAIEYNFNQNIGLIGGVWFPLNGKNTAHFMTYMLELNAFW